MKRLLLTIVIGCNLSVAAIAQTWPTALPEAKAGTRWWWLGSAVDRDGLEWNLGEYSRTGIGTVEITPLYGVKGNEHNELSFLSPGWMQALKDVEDIAARLGIEVDMNCGTGWPFGGPQVPLDEAACKATFTDTIIDGKKQIDIKVGRTKQKVKRAAPGGEGWVVDHFDKTAVKHYLDRFEEAFASSDVSYPLTFFNDSYEVYHANWTPTLFDEFKKRRGYDLRDYLPELLGQKDDGNKVLADYRETLSDLLYENFTLQWVDWAHKHGVKVRNQAHGSPANLLDLYAAVDIPEIEGFGLSEFGIKGLRTDSGMTRKNFSDVSMLKYASSAAHVTGKRFTSSETFTWLTEHFRTSLSQMKPDLDLMFTCGVNHVFFHGSCYSPKDDTWPGWKFYASIDMSPTNSIWHDAPYLMQYIERCQSYLQSGQPDNDFLVYLPVYDMWTKRLEPGEKGLLMQFDIHSMDEKSPEFISSVLKIDSLGYDCDYISDRLLEGVTIDDGMLKTAAGTRYKALIIPTGTTIRPLLAERLKTLSPYVIYGEDESDMSRYAKAEEMKKGHGLRCIRRKNDEGFFYFIANLSPNDVEEWFSVTADMKSAAWFNPMDGSIYGAEVSDGRVKICLRSGESRILQTYQNVPSPIDSSVDLQRNHCTGKDAETEEIDLTNQSWSLDFVESAPRVSKKFNLTKLQSWENLDDDSVKVTMGTGAYTTTVKLSKEQAGKSWVIELGDVRESARVYINGTFVGCAWAVPFVVDTQGLLRKGRNEIRIEVTNLPANRIAYLDRVGYPWRKFKEINVVDINYKRTTYEHWNPVASGLNSSVRLIGKKQ